MDLTCAAYLNRPIWDALPVVPHIRRSHCNMMFLVCYKGGSVQDVSTMTLDEIRAMPSYQGIEMFVSAGSEIEPTTDCFSWLGNVQLSHRFIYFVFGFCCVVIF